MGLESLVLELVLNWETKIPKIQSWTIWRRHEKSRQRKHLKPFILVVQTLTWQMNGFASWRANLPSSMTCHGSLLVADTLMAFNWLMCAYWLSTDSGSFKDRSCQAVEKGAPVLGCVKIWSSCLRFVSVSFPLRVHNPNTCETKEKQENGKEKMCMGWSHI